MRRFSIGTRVVDGLLDGLLDGGLTMAKKYVFLILVAAAVSSMGCKMPIGGPASGCSSGGCDAISCETGGCPSATFTSHSGTSPSGAGVLARLHGRAAKPGGRGAVQQAPGPPTATTAYPYYTLHGPRDFLQVPPPLGP